MELAVASPNQVQLFQTNYTKSHEKTKRLLKTVNDIYTTQLHPHKNKKKPKQQRTSKVMSTRLCSCSNRPQPIVTLESVPELPQPSLINHAAVVVINLPPTSS